jgi:putative transcriptional regulator
MKVKKSLGSELVRRLQNFTAKLERGEKITSRTVKLMQPKAYDQSAVKHTRNQLQASQQIFAGFLGVSVSTIHDWEQGRKQPSKSACRFMDEINSNPEYFQGRLKALTAK